MTLTISRHVKAQKSLQCRMKYGVLCRCMPPESYPSSAYCLGCDTNAGRVIILIRFEHYISCGENPCPHRPSNFPLVTQRKGAFYVMYCAIPRPRDVLFCTCCENAECSDIGIPFTRRGQLNFLIWQNLDWHSATLFCVLWISKKTFIKRSVVILVTRRWEHNKYDIKYNIRYIYICKCFIFIYMFY